MVGGLFTFWIQRSQGVCEEVHSYASVQPPSLSKDPPLLGEASTNRVKEPASSIFGKISGSWQLRVKGRHFEEKQKKFSGTEFSLFSSMGYSLIPELAFKLKGKVGFKNDHVQLEYRDEYSKGSFQIYEAIAELRPWPFLSFQAGAIDQNFHSSPLFVYGRSLPGIVEQFEYTLGPITFMVRAQQSLATAESFSVDRSETEETPLFHREIVGVEFQLTPKWRLQGSFSRFLFDRLAAITAADGAKLGHFTFGLGASAKFRYPFAGFTAQTELEYNDPQHIRLLVGGFWLRNEKALMDGQAQHLYFQGSFPISDYRISLSYMNFFKEREAAPAVFSSLSFGGNNRVGYQWGVNFIFEKLGFQVTTELLSVDVIKTAEGMSRGKGHTYYLGLETINVKF